MIRGPFIPAPPSPRATDKMQLLSFFLGAEEYAVDILRVREIRVWESLTRLPTASPFVKGVLNLRGEAVPILDLRERFGLPAPPCGKHTVIIVLQLENEGRRRAVGAIVDGVSDVYDLDRGALLTAPDVNGPVDAECILALGNLGQAMLVILDPDKIFNLTRLPGLTDPSISLPRAKPY